MCIDLNYRAAIPIVLVYRMLMLEGSHQETMIKS